LKYQRHQQSDGAFLLSTALSNPIGIRLVLITMVAMLVAMQIFSYSAHESLTASAFIVPN
jgi:hypothetical protein